MKIANNTWMLAVLLGCLIVLNWVGFISIKRLSESTLGTCLKSNNNTESLTKELANLNDSVAQYTKLHPDAPQTIERALRFTTIQNLRTLQALINSGSTDSSKKYPELISSIRNTVPKSLLGYIESIENAIHNHPAIDSNALVGQLYKSAGSIGSTDTVNYFGGFIRLTHVQNSKNTEGAKQMISAIEAMLNKPHFIECIDMLAPVEPNAIDKTTAIVLADAKARLHVNCLINQLVDQIIEQQ
ncbi:MAG: hypothetical protein JSS50_03230 [Proteobacteria bacterium]|nr:hypothetical protein [Pseudomonadota bacterium]